ncbi:MAG: glycosyl transferase group 1 [Frankiales bacterium]|nr:glycosyl transferase group 1 [Frankiales bacterium]
MRVLCVNDRPPGGDSGAEVHLELLVRGLEARGDTVSVFSGTPKAGLGRLSDTWDPRARAALETRVASFRPDVLHVHNVVRELSVAVLAASPQTPRVMTVHDGRLLGDADGSNPMLRGWQGSRSRWERRFARRRCGQVLAVSGPLAARLAAAGFRDVQRAWPWAEPPVAAPMPPASSRDLLFVGRIDRDKGVHLLVDAFLAADRPGARLLLAGTGPLRLREDPRVVRLGRLTRAEVSAQLAVARAVLLPSLPALRPEGAPLSLIEGLVHGRPLVVSDDPGCREVARGGTARPAGLVVPAGDLRALTTAIGEVLDHDRLVEELAAGAVEAAAEHTPRAGLARVLSAYQRARQ